MKAGHLSMSPMDWLRGKIRGMLANSLPPPERAKRQPHDLNFVEEQLRDREGRIERLDAIVRARLRDKAVQ